MAGILNRLFEIARARLHDTSAPETRAPDPPWDIPEHETSESEQEPEFAAAEHPLAQYYANLEIPQGSDLHTARRAWKRMMKQYHPDLHSGDPERVKLANELSAKLTEAYRALEASRR